MKIIVAGGGRVGSNIAEYLSNDSHDVTVIDNDQSVTRSISEASDVLAIHGTASYPDILAKAGAESAEMIIAATGSDETNMVVCQIAHSLFGVPKKIARIGNPAYLKSEYANLFSRDHLPIDTIISPEHEIAKAIADRIRLPGAFNVLPLANESVFLVGVTCGEEATAVGLSISDLTSGYIDSTIIVAAIIRSGEYIKPEAETNLEAGDEIYFLTHEGTLQDTLELFGHKEEVTRNIIIMGGGSIGLNLARQILSKHKKTSLKIIERSKSKAENLSEDLPEEVVVINGNALDPEIEREAGVSSAEAFIAVSNDSENNILAALMANRQGCRRTVALTGQTAYLPVLKSLGVDVTVNPKTITVSSILRHVRRGQVRADYSLRDGFAELLEMEVDQSSYANHTLVEKLDMPDGAYVVGISRNDKLLMVDSKTMVQAGDRVFIFALHGEAKKTERIFAKRADFY